MAEGKRSKIEQETRRRMTKKNQPLRALMALLLLIAVVLACSSGGNETEKANKLVDEGNAAVQEAKKHITKADELKKKMLMDVSHLDAARAVAKEAIGAYENGQAKCKEAAAKYDEASRLKLNDKFKEYLALKVKEYNKRAEVVQTAKGVPQALIDGESRQGWIAKANSVNEKVNQMVKEADALGAQADKIEKDNPDIFKS
jgi:hypothetical protein